MTFYDDDKPDKGGEVVPELKLRIGGDDDDGVNSKMVNLRQRLLEECEAEERNMLLSEPPLPSRWRRSIWYWMKLGILIAFLGLLAAVFLKWVGPFFMDKELMPIINWEMATFSTPMLAVLVFASVALFPTVLLPSTPSMWVAGMTFGYGFGFLLIISAAAVGVSLPYFIGSLFLHRIQGWLEKYPKKAAILRAAGEGNWFHQFKAVTLIRISPFPYIIYNYCAVATNVKYGPYILGSLVGMVPEIFVAIYTGILIQTLADASHDRHALSAPQILLNVGGFLVTVVTTIVFTVYAKRQLKIWQKEEELLLQ
ncbi:SNARE associated Golgi family protein [Theobroma cacao]|uniref:SNARE associated Golgi family protein n=1 Tax=Theobroma cacao TaxID=3641 RepID=A0A061G3S8_THECC|nr:SNARE associated Golgi family protein [Theobroma cacao]